MTTVYRFNLQIVALMPLVWINVLYAESYSKNYSRPYEGILVVHEIIELEQDPSYIHLANLAQNHLFQLEHTLKRDETEYHRSQKKELGRMIRSLQRLSSKTKTLVLNAWATEEKKPVTVFIQDKKLIAKVNKFKSGDLVHCNTIINGRDAVLAIGWKKLPDSKKPDEANCLYLVKDKDTLVRNLEEFNEWREKYSSGRNRNWYEMYQSHRFFEATELDKVFALTSEGELPPNSYQNDWTIIPVNDTSQYSISIKACDDDDSQLLCAMLSAKTITEFSDLYDVTFEVVEVSSNGKEKIITPKGGMHFGAIENGRYGHFDSDLKKIVVVPANRASEKTYTANIISATKYRRHIGNWKE
jgi:hypothetical protein